jgi:sensor histidine kinase YesM
VAHCKSIATHIVEGIYIFLGAGIVIGTINYISGFPLNQILIISGFNATMWAVMWKGNELIAINLDQRISWLKKPGKRFLIGLGAALLYVLLAATLVNILLVLILGGQLILREISNNIFESTLYAAGFTILIMLILYSISFFKSWRQAAINIEKLEKEGIASKYEILKNQVNPHFLFNTLNALTSLIYEDQDKAVKFINKFSDVYRYVLESKDKEVVPITEELEFVRAFIFLLQSRHEDNLCADFPEEKIEGYVPPMAIQLLIENALKHNVISDENPLRLKITFEDMNLIVENNITELKGNNNNIQVGIGLDNIVSRFEILTDRPVRIENDGRRFRVSLPILQMENS